MYFEKLEIIQKNKAKYVYKKNNININEELNDAIENLAEHDNNTDAPNDVPIINEVFQVTNEYEVFNDRTDEGDIAIDLGDRVPSMNTSHVSSTFSVPNLINDDEYNQLMVQLNEKQRKYLLHVLHSVKSRNSEKKVPFYNIILGSAGVGKSVLIKALYQTLLRHYFQVEPSCNPEEIIILICAPTGKASHNVNGITLHSAFRLPVNECSAELIPLPSSIRNSVYCKLQKLKFILIDEISMVGAKMLYNTDNRLRQIFDIDKPFGGVSVIAFGDFNQLNPVKDSAIYSNHIRSNPLSLLTTNPLWELFYSFHLTEIMRQRDDKEFAEILMHLGNGILNEYELCILESRKNVALPQNQIIHLCKKNEDVDNYNNSILLNIPPSDIVIVTAVDSVLDHTLSNDQKEKLLSNLKTLAIIKTHGLPYTLKLCLNIRYMITNNLNTEDGLVNGVIGSLMQIDYLDNNEVLRVWLEFENESTGKQARQAVNQYCCQHNIPSNWVPINFLKHCVGGNADIMRSFRRHYIAESRNIFAYCRHTHTLKQKKRYIPHAENGI